MPSIFDSVIDLATHDGRKMCSMACKPLGVVLKPDGSNKLEFRNAFKDRVRTCVWSDLLEVYNGTQDEHGADLYEDIIDRTSLITMTQVRDARGQRQPNNIQRELLDVEMMYECLKNSIEEDVATSIATTKTLTETALCSGKSLWTIFPARPQSSKCVSGKQL
jgi:hypothetical protein